MDNVSGKAKRSAEFSGKTVEEALEAAARELAVPVARLTYEVVRDNSRTLFGLVRTGEVVIRVTPAEDEAPVAMARPAVMPAPAAVVEPPVAEVAEEAAPEAEEEEGEDEEEGAFDVSGNPPELARVATDVVSTLLDKMGVYGAVEVLDRGGEYDDASGEVTPLVLNIVGDDLGSLIGRRGETLRDLQFVVRLIVSRSLGVWPNVVLDVENYKEKRVNALNALAARVADQVRRTGEPVTLEPMPAHERRTIHLALRDDPDVYTESIGEGEARKVQVLPK
jgi:spoIIIJ-associated protein